ncbi:myeloid leukemia factor 2 isoform 2-T5 [Morphnus guianensis]
MPPGRFPPSDSEIQGHGSCHNSGVPISQPHLATWSFQCSGPGFRLAPARSGQDATVDKNIPEEACPWSRAGMTQSALFQPAVPKGNRHSPGTATEPVTPRMGGVGVPATIPGGFPPGQRGPATRFNKTPSPFNNCPYAVPCSLGYAGPGGVRCAPPLPHRAGPVAAAVRSGGPRRGGVARGRSAEPPFPALGARAVTSARGGAPPLPSPSPSVSTSSPGPVAHARSEPAGAGGAAGTSAVPGRDGSGGVIGPQASSCRRRKGKGLRLPLGTHWQAGRGRGLGPGPGGPRRGGGESRPVARRGGALPSPARDGGDAEGGGMAAGSAVRPLAALGLGCAHSPPLPSAEAAPDRGKHVPADEGWRAGGPHVCHGPFCHPPAAHEPHAFWKFRVRPAPWHY